MTSYHFFGNEDEAIPEDVTELVIHPLVQFIPELACGEYKYLTSVNFNGSALKVIREAAFCECHALIEIEIPQSVTTIEDGLLTTIGRWAFGYCDSLTDISIPSSVETLQSAAFGKCECLARVSFQDGLKTIAVRGFYECTKLEQVELPRTLEMMGNSSFGGCTLLKKVIIEEGNLKVIGDQAFDRCANLHTIDFPSTIERIEMMAFRNCDSLEVVQFRNGLKYVERRAFVSCKNLQAVELPESIKMIGNGAFQDCPKLVSVGWGGNLRAVSIQTDAFSGCPSLLNICLPSQCRVALMFTNETCFGIVSKDNFGGCTALENHCGGTDVPYALMSRFENFPIHKKCYHTSVTIADELAREIESLPQSSEEEIGDRLVDPFSVTPFHVLLSAANCRNDLLQVLLDAYPPNILGLKDVNGKTAIEYLTQRRYPDEASRIMLRMALKGWLVDNISNWNGLDIWKSDMSNRVNTIVAEDDVEQRQSLLEEASMVLSRYELMEAATLLELSLWKMELKSTNTSADDEARTTVDKEKRREFRIRSGASVVIPNVIALL